MYGLMILEPVIKFSAAIHDDAHLSWGKSIGGYAEVISTRQFQFFGVKSHTIHRDRATSPRVSALQNITTGLDGNPRIFDYVPWDAAAAPPACTGVVTAKSGRRSASSGLPSHSSRLLRAQS